MEFAVKFIDDIYNINDFTFDIIQNNIFVLKFKL